jgi:hypothetical protein
MGNPAAAILFHPLFLFVVSAAIFILVIWSGLPFALYGMRRRLSQNGEKLDRIAGILERIHEVLMAQDEREEMRLSEISDDGARTGAPTPAGRLFVDLRKEMLQFAPLLQERALDTGFVVMLFRDKSGAEVPAMVISIQEDAVQVTIQVETLRLAFPGFQPDQFCQYAASFLPEKHGYHTIASPDGQEFHVNIDPGDSSTLDLFIGIIREQMVEPVKGDADEGIA